MHGHPNRVPWHPSVPISFVVCVIHTDGGGELWGSLFLRKTLSKMESPVLMEPTGAEASSANGKTKRSIGLAGVTNNSTHGTKSTMGGTSENEESKNERKKSNQTLHDRVQNDQIHNQLPGTQCTGSVRVAYSLRKDED
jgi:hypothetical protein